MRQFITETDAIARIRTFIQDSDKNVQLGALETLGYEDSAWQSSLLTSLDTETINYIEGLAARSDSPEMRRRALHTLAMFGRSCCLITLFVDILRDPDMGVRRAAADELLQLLPHDPSEMEEMGGIAAGKISLVSAAAEKTILNEGLVGAVKGCFPDLVEQLLSRGADSNFENVLILASKVEVISFDKPLCGKGRLSIVRLLVSGGANVNSRDRLGTTALMNAAGLGDAEVVRSLLSKGASAGPRRKDGQTALTLFRSNQAFSFVPWELKDRVEANNRLLDAARHGYPNIDSLLQSGAEVNAQNDAGQTPLMLLLQNASSATFLPELVSKLISAGADVNIRDNEGLTALQYAMQKRDLLPKRKELPDDSAVRTLRSPDVADNLAGVI